MDQHTAASCDVTIESRANDAIKDMPSCIARMVADKEQLVCNKGGSFQIAAVMDCGGFATLLKGQVKLNGAPQVGRECRRNRIGVWFWPAPLLQDRKSVTTTAVDCFLGICCRLLLPR